MSATNTHVAADGMNFHLLNFFFHDEIKAVSLLLGWFVNLTGVFHSMLLFRSVKSLEPGIIYHQVREVLSSPADFGLESGVEASAAIRTQILRNCLLQASDMSWATSMRSCTGRERASYQYALVM